MANTLTGLYPVIVKSLDVVSREQIGLINAVNRDSSAEQVALNESITIPVAPQGSTANNTPGVNVPDTGDQTIATTSMSMSKSKHYPIRWNGEETLGLKGSGAYVGLVEKRFQQAFRTIANEVEADLAGLHVNASRAYGTAGTTPFGTADDLTDFSKTAQILKDNGASPGYKIVLGTAAEANLIGKQSSIFKANEAGGTDGRMNGKLARLLGFDIHISGQILTNTAGTGASYQLNGALAVGDTTVTVDTGSGTILAGDVVTISSHKYVVKTALSGGSFTIEAPGIRQVVADNTTITVNGAAARNMAFGDGAIYLATRAPAMPEMGDLSNLLGAPEYVTDPISGLVYQIVHYGGFRQMTTHVALAWGYKVVAPRHLALLLG